MNQTLVCLANAFFVHLGDFTVISHDTVNLTFYVSGLCIDTGRISTFYGSRSNIMYRSLP